jgi:hypothetical protein
MGWSIGPTAEFVGVSIPRKNGYLKRSRIGYHTGGEGPRHLSWLEWLEELL